MEGPNRLMSGDEYQATLTKLGITYSDLARFLNTERRTTHRWLDNGPIDSVARLLQALMLLREASVLTSDPHALTAFEDKVRERRRESRGMVPYGIKEAPARAKAGPPFGRWPDGEKAA